MRRILSIVESAYRATIEEQDDTILWLTQMLKNAGADMAILLRANAVNYAATGQDASGIAFRKTDVAHPPEIEKDVSRMIESGIAVFAVEEDIVERGLAQSELIPGIRKLKRKEIATLVDGYDQVGHW